MSNVPKMNVFFVPLNDKEVSTREFAHKGESKYGRMSDQICGKCKGIRHGNKDLKGNVYCVVCKRYSHGTEHRTALKQPKPVAKYVGFRAKELGYN